MKLLAIVLATGLACATAHAADKDGNYQIMGAGAVKCQKYLGANKQDRLYTETWWAGYVTAINRTTDDTWSVTGKKSVADINTMLEKECTAHPDEVIAIAVRDVVEDLYKSRTKSDPNK